MSKRHWGRIHTHATRTPTHRQGTPCSHFHMHTSTHRAWWWYPHLFSFFSLAFVACGGGGGGYIDPVLSWWKSTSLWSHIVNTSSAHTSTQCSGVLVLFNHTVKRTVRPKTQCKSQKTYLSKCLQQAMPLEIIVIIIIVHECHSDHYCHHIYNCSQ